MILAQTNMDSVAFEGVEQALTEADTQVLLFGKPTARPGRRMGVALARGGDRKEAQAKADRAAACVTVIPGSTGA